LITRSDVDHVALLARLELTDKEKNTYTQQLNSILGYFESLQRLNTEEVQPTAHVLPLQNVFREDKTGQHMTTGQVLANAPDRDDDFFKVPKII